MYIDVSFNVRDDELQKLKFIKRYYGQSRDEIDAGDLQTIFHFAIDALYERCVRDLELWNQRKEA